MSAGGVQHQRGGIGATFAYWWKNDAKVFQTRVKIGEEFTNFDEVLGARNPIVERTESNTLKGTPSTQRLVVNPFGQGGLARSGFPLEENRGCVIASIPFETMQGSVIGIAAGLARRRAAKGGIGGCCRDRRHDVYSLVGLEKALAGGGRLPPKEAAIM